MSAPSPRTALARARATLADLTDLRALLARVGNAFSELAAHPDDEATIRAARRSVATATDSAWDQVCALILREQARVAELEPEVAALDAAEDEEEDGRGRGARVSRAAPRPSDVARWVAELASPEPDRLTLGGAALREALAPRKRARASLRSWGLDDAGKPLAPATTPPAPPAAP